MSIQTSQLKSLAMIAEGLAVLAGSLYGAARKAEHEEAVDHVGEVLSRFFGADNVQRTGQQTKGDQPEQPQATDGNTDVPAADEPVSETTASAEAAPPTKLEQVLALLNDERYTLRSASSIQDKTGLDVDAVEELLEENGIEYVIRHKRGTREVLFGLAARN